MSTLTFRNELVTAEDGTRDDLQIVTRHTPVVCYKIPVLCRRHLSFIIY